MIIIYKNDGSIFSKSDSDYIQQGSNDVNKIFVGFVDNAHTTFSCVARFIRANDTETTQMGVTTPFTYNGYNYLGWVFNLTSEETKYAGNLKVFITFYDAFGGIQNTYITNLIINATGYPATGEPTAPITTAEFNSFMAQIAAKQPLQGMTSVVVEQLPASGVVGVLYFLKGALTEKVYSQYIWNGSAFVWVGSLVLDAFATLEEQRAFEEELREEWQAYYLDLNNQWNAYKQQVDNKVNNALDMTPIPVATVNDLPPQGATQPYVVAEDGYWYYWNGTQWVQGQQYQAVTGYKTLPAGELNTTLINEIVENAGSLCFVNIEGLGTDVTLKDGTVGNVIGKGYAWYESESGTIILWLGGNMFVVNDYSPYEISNYLSAKDISFDNSNSGLDANNVQSAIDSFFEFNPDSNLIDRNALIDGKYINENGTLSGYADFSATDYIPLEPNKSYYWFEIYTGYYAFYDENKILIEGHGNDQSLTLFTPFTTPANTAYGRFTLVNETQKTTCWLFDKDYLPEDYSFIKKKINVSNLNFVKHNPNTNMINIARVQTGYVKDGVIRSRTGSEPNWKNTDYIPLEPNKSYYWNGLFTGYYAFYDENYNIVSFNNNDYSLTNPFTFPANAVYARFSIRPEIEVTPDTCWISDKPNKPNEYGLMFNNIAAIPVEESITNPCDYKGKSVMVFNKGIAIGDSTTAGTFNYTVEGSDANYETYEKYAYPAYFKKYTGVDIDNKGKGGYTSEQVWQFYQNVDLSGYDFAVVSLGINDNSYDLTAEQTISAITNIVNKLKSDNENIKIFITTITPAYSYGVESQYEVRNNAIKSVAENNVNCYLIDLTKYGHALKGTPYENGHPSALGYMITAQDIANAISYIIDNNLNAFRNVQFIGTDYMYED